MTARRSKPAFPYVADIAFQAGDIVFATDRQGLVVYWNKEAEEISGNKTEEALGQPYTLACRMEPGFDALDISAVLGGRDFAGGVRCHSRSGGEAALYLFATVGRNRSGEPAGVVFVGRDVTGLWQAEEAVQASTDKYRVLFENTQDSVAIADIDGRVLEANPACFRLYGYTGDDVKEMNLTDVVAPEDRRAAKAAMASLAAGRSVSKTIRMRRKDGTRFVVDLVASVVMVGGERRIMSVTRDATGRARAEQVESQSEQMYRAVFESANDAVFIESVDGRILDVNRNGCELVGYRRDELVRMNVSDLVPAGARAWLPHVTDAILRDRTFRTEAVNMHKSGRHVPVEISASTMELDGRTVVLAIVRDIAERKRAEAALAESENRYRALFDESLMGIYRTSPDGQILMANPALVRMLGYDSFAQLAERNLEADGSGPDYRRDEFKRRLECDGRIVGLEVGWQTRDGRTLFVRENARAVRGQDGAVLYYEGTVEDITDRKATEPALRQEKELAHSYLEVTGSIMVALDENGAVKLINRKGCAVLGGTPGDIIGRNWFEAFVPERLRAEVRRVFAGLMSGELEPMEYHENPVVTLRGEERLVAWHNALLRDDAGRVVGTLSSGEDVTERKELAREAAAAAAQAQAVLDNSPGAIAAECDGRLVYANRPFVRMFGYESPEQVVGRPASEFDAPEDRAALMEYSRIREHGGDAPTGYVFRGLKRDGTIAPMEARISTYRSRGRLHILAFIREIEPDRGDR
jgi:PAS domain S-box-containing protein